MQNEGVKDGGRVALAIGYEYEEEGDLAEGARILIVEDDAAIRVTLATYLTENRFVVHQADSAAAARATLASNGIDLALLDINLPGEDGLSLCRDFRATTDMAIIMVTAQKAEIDRIVGLELGADDYIPKPFNPRELLARIRSVLRRTKGDSGTRPETKPRTFCFAGWTLRLDQRDLVGADEIAITLSSGEFALLQTLLAQPGVILSREDLLQMTRNRSADVFDRSIDNMISRLRRKIEPDPKEPEIIKTIWGGGYLLAAEVERR